jgi:hypothetical protein
MPEMRLRTLSAAELAAAGATAETIADGVDSGTLVRLDEERYAAREGWSPVDVRALTHGYGLVLSHGSAAARWGAPSVQPLRAVHATCPRNCGLRVDAIDHVRLHRVDLPRSDLTLRSGVLVTRPVRTALDCCRWLALDDAVAVCDGLIRLGRMSESDLVAGMDRYRGPHRTRMWAGVQLVDARRESPLESLTGVLLWRRGVPVPSPQYVVRHKGRFVGRCDFAWPEARLVLECDGFAYHRDAARFRADRRRWAALVRAGWRVIAVTWADVVEDPDYVATVVHDLLGTVGRTPFARTVSSLRTVSAASARPV